MLYSMYPETAALLATMMLRVMCTAYSRACLWWNGVMAVEYTHDEYCSFSAPSLPVIFKTVLTHANSHYVNLADVIQVLMCFYRWQQHFHETPSVTPTALVNPGRPRCVRTPAIEDVLTAAVEWKYVHIYSLSHEDWDLCHFSRNACPFQGSSSLCLLRL